MPQHYHIVGIAGAGMSALANLLLDQGNTISGSDLVANQLTSALQARGALIHTGHDAAYVVGAPHAHPPAAVIATSAARADHPELAAARATGIPVWKRDELWRTWSQQRPVIAIAGTHGKTTTSALVAFVLERAGLAPGFYIGGEPLDLGTNARWGDPSAPLVIEADEYDRAFLALTPRIAVITNVEWDHPDIYPDPADYQHAFVQFAHQTSQVILTCGDSAMAGGFAALLHDTPLQAQVLTYGIEAASDYHPAMPGVAGEQQERGATGAAIPLEPQRLRIAGQHNIRNALAALAVAHLLGIAPAAATEALYAFRGTARRFQVKGERDGVLVVDDYAHHPTEVRATLAAARGAYPQRRIVAYVQPHTYSRTRSLIAQWPAAFGDADMVAVGDIYASREPDPPEAAGGDLPAAAVVAQHLTRQIAHQHPQVHYVGDTSTAAARLLTLLEPGDVLLTLGAGDGYRVGEALLAHRDEQS